MIDTSLHQRIAYNLTSSGYGVSFDRALEIVSKLSEKDLEDLMYLCHRTAEKLGADFFTIDDLDLKDEL